MVVFQEAALRAAPVRADERTLPTVAGPDLAFDLRGNMARGFIDVARYSWASGRRVTGLVEGLEQESERSIEDRGRIAVRNDVMHQILNFTEAFVHLQRHRELDFVRLRGQWTNNCWPSLFHLRASRSGGQVELRRTTVVSVSKLTAMILRPAGAGAT